MMTSSNNPQISAEIIQDSISPDGKRITTFLLEYPRMIHAELMTHRLFSRNAASSRAIPVMDKIRNVWNNPAMPSFWGINQPGMQATNEMTGVRKNIAKFLWVLSSKIVCILAFLMFKLKLHKQLTNRILEIFEMYRVIVTATEYDNWFYLRCHKDAQPEIRDLAWCMYNALKVSTPIKLQYGEWHLPFVDYVQTNGKGKYRYMVNGFNVGIETAIRVSVSCCAQVSYRKSDTSIEKANMIFDRLIESKPMHASPCEHQATPMGGRSVKWAEGVTHKDSRGNYWSGNFQGWIQYRQSLNGNTIWEPTQAP